MYAVEDFCAQRPNKTGANIKSWGHVNNVLSDLSMKNNVFALASDRLLETYVRNGSSPEYLGNTYIQFENVPLGRTG